MSKAVPFTDDLLGSPEADPLNQTDLSSSKKPSARRRKASGKKKKSKRGLDSVFTPSEAFPDSENVALDATHQKAVLIVRTARNTRGLDELNRALSNGWELLQVTLVGDSEDNAPWLSGTQSDTYFSALVFVEQQQANKA